MKRVLRTATLVMIGLLAAPLAVAAEMQSFWDLKPQQLRVLVAAPQVMVTRTASGLDAYCRCPVVLKPHEIPEAMKKAIIAVEDKRFMDQRPGVRGRAPDDDRRRPCSRHGGKCRLVSTAVQHRGEVERAARVHGEATGPCCRL